VLQPGAQLAATGSTSAGDGAITLTANNVDYGTIANPLFQMGQELFKPPTNSTIQIGSNVLITGGDRQHPDVGRRVDCGTELRQQPVVVLEGLPQRRHQ
jgi:hypothetical protein